MNVYLRRENGKLRQQELLREAMVYSLPQTRIQRQPRKLWQRLSHGLASFRNVVLLPKQGA